MSTGHMRLMGRGGLVVMLAVGACACSGSGSTAAATTTASTRTTETFSGTVTVGGSDVHNFPVGAAGIVDVTLTAAAPPAAVVMGISIGVPANGTCTPLSGASTNASAGSSVQLSGLVSLGTLCVDVRDAGSQSDTVSYTVSVTHP